MNPEPLVDELVLRGSDDWVDACEVAWVVKSTGGAAAEDEIFAVSLTLMRLVLERGLMVAGDVTEEGFSAWGLAPDEALACIETSWRALGRLPTLGEVCWLANTTEGDERARTLTPGEFRAR